MISIKILERKMLMKKLIIIYHNDHDGRCAAFLIKNIYQDYNITYIPITYDIDKEEEKVIGKLNSFSEKPEAFIVDITLSLEGMLNLIDLTSKLTWIDHHITIKDIEDKLKEKPFFHLNLNGIRSIDKSACLLTWDYLYGNFPPEIPFHFIELIDDYDRWIFRYGNDTKYFNEWLNQFDTAPWKPIWLDLMYPTRKYALFDINYLRSGKIIYEYKIRTLKRSFGILSNKIDLTIDGKNAKAVEINSSDIYSNNYYADIAKNEGYSVIIMYYYKKDKEGNLIKINQIRSVDDIDVSEYAKERGGGGHKHAAGWREIQR
jgi:oligoribonuclease NrnB/cAMP/cGMP phosphodiesterase (DHH superfamily)